MPSKGVLHLTLPLCALLAGGTAWAQGSGKVTAATPITTPPTIDGRLDDAAWRQAEPITDFHQIEPVEFGQPFQRTEIRLLYDSKNLYIGVRLEYDDIEELTAQTMVPAQRIFSDDRFSIVLDPFLDRRNGYYFEINAHAIQADALLENNARMLADWDGIWRAETHIDESGWTAEIAIPFSTVSFDPSLDRWGINFFREFRVRQETLAWASKGRQSFLEAPVLAGTMTGLEGLQQGLGLDVVPSVTLKDEKDYETGASDFSFEPSLDLTYRITPSLTGRLTFNTDFSATEVDARQVNLTRFSLFFPEKREFFLQDAGIFEFANLGENGRPFFSRTIGLTEDGEPLNLNYGGKLTGRLGDFNLGFLGVQQEAYATLGARDLFVGRTTYNLLRESSLGFIITDGDPEEDRDARTLGVDFRFYTTRFLGGRVLQGEAWYQVTDNEQTGAVPAGDAGGDDDAWGIHLLYPEDRHRLDLRYYHFGKDFDPAMGFINRPGIDDFRLFYRFRARPKSGFFLTIDQEFSFRNIESVFNEEKTQTVRFNPIEAESRYSDEYEAFIYWEREVLVEGFFLFDRLWVPPGDYDYLRYGVDFTSARYRVWELGFRLEGGDFFDGQRDSWRVRMEWKPSARFNIRGEYVVNDVSLVSGDFTSRLWSLKSEIAITNRWSLIPLIQFDNVSDNMGINLRLHWQPVRGQNLFFVWNRNMVRDFDGDFHDVSQEAVIKGVYTFRF
jgi:hypothetical protein